MTDTTIEEAKAALRARAHQQRAAFLEEHRSDMAGAVAEHFFSGVSLGPDDVVAAYWPIRDELDCRPVVTRLLAEGRRVCMPAVVGRGLPLEMRLWVPGAPLHPAGFGTMAPDGDAPVLEPDVVLVPLLGFDKHGTRLGYGGGYYDRTIAVMAKRPGLIGLGFAAQEVDHIPCGPHDISLDAVVTERGIRRFAGNLR